MLDHQLGPESQTLCTFWLGRRCFGLDVGCVGEVVAVDTVTPVPMARPALRGVFNLRGTPTPVVDLAEVLSLGNPAGERSSTKVAMVIRDGDLNVAVLIDKMEAVLPPGRGASIAPQSTDEHPAVAGFLDAREGGGRVVTILAPRVVLDRLNALRYLAPSEDD
jgi:purine-binding chemotaxis protein CheW